MSDTSVSLEESWKAALAGEFSSPYMQQLKSFLVEQKQVGKRVFPKGSEYFRALDLTPVSKVEVVILGQDPYHGLGQAHGLCFSVRPGVRIPPSLVNIYKEMETDLGIAPPRHGFLEHWARQGVLLLNGMLTVEEGGRCPIRGGVGALHRRRHPRGQRSVRARRLHALGLLCPAQGRLRRTARHLVLQAPHPSPLSAHHGFLGCRHFVKANAFLQSRGRAPIDWQLPANLLDRISEFS